jgi:hypothetical protein
MAADEDVGLCVRSFGPFAKHGILPFSGGLLDQPAVLVDALLWIEKAVHDHGRRD